MTAVPSIDVSGWPVGTRPLGPAPAVKAWHSEDDVLIRATMDPWSARIISMTTYTG